MPSGRSVSVNVPFTAMTLTVREGGNASGLFLASDESERDYQPKLNRRWWIVEGRHEAVCTSWRRRSSVRRKQIATIRIPPQSRAMSPMLNSPSRAWSASSGNRVCDVAPCHIGLAGRTVDGIPTTGIDPALMSVTRAFIPSPQSISRTPVRTKGDRTNVRRATGSRRTHTARSLDIPSMLTDVPL